MADILLGLSWLHVMSAVVVYTLSLAFYRLFFHPLSGFPGPALAAITRYYEGYYDLYQNGQYTFRIAEMHKKYGPIIRISPYELHVSDPAFFDVLYRQEAHYDKYDWAIDAFGIPGATGFTVKHSDHRARRQPLSPFFSKSRVAGSQDLIHRHADKLVRRLDKFVEAGTTFDLGAAMTAFARDVVSSFVLGKDYNCLDREDFDVAMLKSGQGAGQVWRLSKFVRFIAPIMQSIPPSWIVKTASEEVKPFFRHMEETQKHIRELMAAATSPASVTENSRTLIHEIMESKLPVSEKAFKRVSDDVFTTTAAGYETTASVLRLILFHIFSNDKILQRLRGELASAGARSDRSLELKALEQLPYLTAILHEGMRLSPAIASRMARVSPDLDMVYDKWRIPAGTPVGMTLILMHTDETLYPNAKTFDPDRWMEAGTLKRIQKGFAPFSKGTRNCLGMHLAWAEIYILVADLAQRFDFHCINATAEDFEFESDQFAIGTKGKGHLRTTVTRHQVSTL